jgi:molecular chaperone HscC
MIGIDLGTTNSLVAILRDGEAVVLANELGEDLTPSAVAVAADGTTLVGRAAKDRLIQSPRSGRAFFKRDMGTDARYSFGEREWTPVECSARILAEMKRIAARHLGEAPRSAVISVPAYFHDQQRQATLEAAEIAGLKVERIINEPTAAALAYGFRQPNAEQRLLVFDLGGGTFDVTVLEVYEGVIEVKASGGDSRLGGEDYTDAIARLLGERFGFQVAAEEFGRWRQRVEVAKRQLASSKSVAFQSPDGQALELTRDLLTLAGAELTARLRPIVKRCLRDAQVEASDLDDVLLVGGASRMAVVHDLIHEVFGRIPNGSLDPDRVVAQGAAVQSALCRQDRAVSELVLTDVCPHTLGVEISKEFRAGHIENGFFAPLIDRNTTVPVSRSDVFHTISPEQDEIQLRVYQGEARMVNDNRKIGEVRVRGLRHKPGQKRPGVVEVRFSYDMNGVLEVEATVLETGRKVTQVFEQRPGHLSQKEIADAVRRLQPLKVHPRDSFANRARLERTNRLFTELIGPSRDELTFHVDRFEAALESQDGEAIQTAGLYLDNFVRRFYQYEGELQPLPDAESTPQSS